MILWQGIPKKRTEEVGKAKRDELLRRINCVIVYAAEGLGDSNVFDEKHNQCCG